MCAGVFFMQLVPLECVLFIYETLGLLSSMHKVRKENPILTFQIETNKKHIEDLRQTGQESNVEKELKSLLENMSQ